MCNYTLKQNVFFQLIKSINESKHFTNHSVFIIYNGSISSASAILVKQISCFSNVRFHIFHDEIFGIFHNFNYHKSFFCTVRTNWGSSFCDVFLDIQLYFRCNIPTFFKGFSDFVKNFFGIGTDGMVMIPARDIHKLCGFSCSDTLNKLLDMKTGKNIKLCGHFAIYLMPNKDINYGTTEIDNQIQFILGFISRVM